MPRIAHGAVSAGDRNAALTLTAVSYNVHSCVGLDGRCEPERIWSVVESLGGSIVGLQEVDARVHRHRVDQFELFTARSGMRCIAGPNIVGRQGAYGNMLLTRWPVERYRLIRLPSRHEPRGAICAVLRCGDHRLQVLNTHLGLSRSERRRQTAALLDEACDHDGPTLFLGDFNVWHRRSNALTRLDAPRDAARAPRTFPSRRPLLALDRIWTQPAGMLHSIEAVRDAATTVASDHLPLRAVLTLSAAGDG